jgi:methionyl-tRNA formyltransferase
MRIVFFGTPAFSLPTLEALHEAGENIVGVVTQPDRRKGRHQSLSAPPVKEFAVKNRMKVLQPLTITQPSFIEVLTGMRPDVIVVVAYGKIFPREVLRLPVNGCINVHASLLPKYRGAAPVQWALLRGDDKTGVTTMLMDEGLDTGAILLQEETLITKDDNAETLGKRLSELGAAVLTRTLGKMRSGSLRPAPQEGLPTYAPPLKKEDGKIIWTKSAEELANFVRGMYPWPGTYCHLRGERIKIIKARAVEGSGVAGRVEQSGQKLIIGTGDGLLSVIELQPENKRSMSAISFLQGRSLAQGTMFDEQ